MPKTSQYPIDSDFVVRYSSQPGGYSYVKIAILEVLQGVTSVHAIDVRLSDVRSIVEVTGAYHFGKTIRSEGRMALAAAEDACEALNKAQVTRRRAAKTRLQKRTAAETLCTEPALESLALAT